MLDDERRVATEPQLRAVGKQDRELADCIGAQRVTGKQVLLDVNAAPRTDLDETRFLARLARDD
ncbi:hypothetical protein L610_001700000040 [Aminobacter sp. J44]|nr:hypothetical protein L610_001700000040 [Aminobacter sp. J44]